MTSDPCHHQQPSWPPLSDEAAVIVLAFLQQFTECQNFGEIHRYYQERSQANRKTEEPSPFSDPPF